MKTLRRNFCALENLRGNHTLSDLIMKEDLDIMFLQEKKFKQHAMESWKYHLNFSNCFSVDYVVRSENLAILYKMM